MEKEFNVTGTCIPEMHYMVDTSGKLQKIIKMIEKEKYFIINRPRQYGKTTTLFLLNKKLKKDQTYLPIKISFEGIGDSVFESEKSFSKTFLQILERNLLLNDKNLATFLEEQEVKVQNLNDLS
ncbi:MAG: putative AAA-ATPase, partial [Clostridiaceae bacterium]|nr:putative AAA-ATPase [Clostridiaceae bacterium]